MSFKKEKISQTALDNFVQKYKSKTGNLPYTLKNGEQIKIDTIAMLTSKDGNAHYCYLLGQTAPYHMPQQEQFPLQYIAYTVGEKNKLVPWSSSPKVLSQFVTIGQELAYILCKKDTKGNPVIERSPSVKPIIHTERTHTDD